MGLKGIVAGVKEWAEESERVASANERIAETTRNIAKNIDDARNAKPVVLGPNGKPAGSAQSLTDDARQHFSLFNITHNDTTPLGQKRNARPTRPLSGDGSNSGSFGSDKFAAIARRSGWPGGWPATVLASVGLDNSPLNWLSVFEMFSLYGADYGGATAQAITDYASYINQRGQKQTIGTGGGGGGRSLRWAGGPSPAGAAPVGDPSVGGGAPVAPRPPGAPAPTPPSGGGGGGGVNAAAPIVSAINAGNRAIVTALNELKRQVAYDDRGVEFRRAKI